MEEKQTLYQCKWYDTKEKAYTDCFTKNLQTVIKIAKEKFDEGSKYFSINLVDII